MCFRWLAKHRRLEHNTFTFVHTYVHMYVYRTLHSRVHTLILHRFGFSWKSNDSCHSADGNKLTQVAWLTSWADRRNKNENTNKNKNTNTHSLVAIFVQLSTYLHSPLYCCTAVLHHRCSQFSLVYLKIWPTTNIIISLLLQLIGNSLLP